MDIIRDRMSRVSNLASLKPSTTPRNALLRSLLPADFHSLQPYLSMVPLSAQTVLHEIGKKLDYVYFVESGVVSLMSGTIYEMIQTASVSQQGAVGVTLVCGSDVATHHAVVLAPGAALRVSTCDLRQMMAVGHPIKRILLNGTVHLLEVGCQTALCTASHSNEQRLASWLAMTTADLEGKAIPVTHARLSNLLGLRRAGLTEALTRFEKKGLIRKFRGHISVCSPGKLQLAACGCYRNVSRLANVESMQVMKLTNYGQELCEAHKTATSGTHLSATD